MKISEELRTPTKPKRSWLKLKNQAMYTALGALYDSKSYGKQIHPTWSTQHNMVHRQIRQILGQQNLQGRMQANKKHCNRNTEPTTFLKIRRSINKAKN